MKLHKLYEEIITETVGRNKIIDAIKQKRVVTIWYEGDTTEHKGYRNIEPYVYGINKNGNPVLRAWQRAGVSDTPNGKIHDPLTKIPGWRMFRVDGIKSMQDLGHEKFSQPQVKYNPADKDMTTIYVAAEFGSTPPPESQAPATPNPTQPTSGQVTPVTPATTQPKSKQSMFGKWLDKFKHLVGYSPSEKSGYKHDNTKY